MNGTKLLFDEWEFRGMGIKRFKYVFGISSSHMILVTDWSNARGWNSCSSCDLHIYPFPRTEQWSYFGPSSRHTKPGIKRWIEIDQPRNEEKAARVEIDSKQGKTRLQK